MILPAEIKLLRESLYKTLLIERNECLVIDLLTQAEVMNVLQAICSVVDMPLTMEADVGQGKDLDVIRVGAVGTIANRFRKTIRDVVVSMPATLQKTRADQISGGRLSSFARLVVPLSAKRNTAPAFHRHWGG